jgi:hypothetical protein
MTPAANHLPEDPQEPKLPYEPPQIESVKLTDDAAESLT